MMTELNFIKKLEALGFEEIEMSNSIPYYQNLETENIVEVVILGSNKALLRVLGTGLDTSRYSIGTYALILQELLEMSF